MSETNGHMTVEDMLKRILSEVRELKTGQMDWRTEIRELKAEVGILDARLTRTQVEWQRCFDAINNV